MSPGTWKSGAVRAVVGMLGVLALIGAPVPQAAALPCAPGQDPVPLRINVGRAAAYAPIMVGLDKGFYKEAGLSVQTANVTVGPQVVAAILGGSLDAGGTIALNLYPAVAQGASLKIITVYAGGGDRYALVAGKNSGITRLADIVGKRVGVEQGSGSHRTYDAMLKAEGIQPGAVKMVPLSSPDMPAALGVDQVDAVITYEPFVSRMEAEGAGRIIARAAKYVGGAWAVIVAHPNYVRDCPEGIRRFVLAHFRAMQFLRQRPDESVEIIRKYLPTVAPEVIRVTLKYFEFDPRLTEGQLQSMRQDGDFLVKLGRIKQPPNYAEVFDTTFAHLVTREKPDLVSDLK